MLHSLLSRVLSAPDSPTADLYFRNACADFLGAGVAQIAPTVFASSTACVVMRHAMRAGRLPARRRLIYLIDDDVDAGTADGTLPFFYRQKLRMVEQPHARHFKRFAGVAVVGSPVLARLFSPLMRTHLLRPYWSEALAPLEHFDGLGTGDPIDMAFLGSVVHRSDLEFLLPVVKRLLDEHPRLRFHVPERHRLPADFDRHPRVHRITGLGWTAYRREIATRRFHLTLYPLLDTPFNRARSGNKLIEHAVVGSAAVYSEHWREAKRAVVSGAGVGVSNRHAEWYGAISALLADPAEMRRLAAGAQKLARRINTSGPQRRLWSDLLGLQEPAFA
ncbi:MAG: hypothetical protein AAGB15_11195 [Pseudomonadota bacterium]